MDLKCLLYVVFLIHYILFKQFCMRVLSELFVLQYAKILFFNCLVEDKTALGLSYVEYLVQTHRQIQNRMT